LTDIILKETYKALCMLDLSEDRELDTRVNHLFFRLDDLLKKDGVCSEGEVIDYFKKFFRYHVSIVGEDRVENLSPIFFMDFMSGHFPPKDNQKLENKIEISDVESQFFQVVIDKKALFFGLSEAFYKLRSALFIMIENEKNEIPYKLLFEAATAVSQWDYFQTLGGSINKQKAASKRWKSKDQVKEYALALYQSQTWKSAKQASKILAGTIIKFSEEETTFRFSSDSYQATETIYKWFLEANKNKK